MLAGRPIRRVAPTPLERIFALRWRLYELNQQLDAIERNSPMARVRMFGTEFTAEVLKDNGDGTFLMKAKQHTARTAVGTQFTATRKEITEMAAAEMPGTDRIKSLPGIDTMWVDAPDGGTVAVSGDSGQSALDAAMADERKTIATPAEIIAAYRKDKGIEPAPAPTTGVSVPPGPTVAPTPAPNPPGPAPMTSRIAEKAKLLASTTKGFQASVEGVLDTAIAAVQTKQSDATTRLGTAMQSIKAVTADADAGLQAIDDLVSQLTNE